VFDARNGSITEPQIRVVEVSDALAGTGATHLSMPGRLAQQLGLYPVGVRKARTDTGQALVQMYSSVRLTIQGRDCTTEVSEGPDDWPVLIGKIPLALLDFVVDRVGQRLIGDPAHGGEPVIDMF
jgi:hypothetical protein